MRAALNDGYLNTDAVQELGELTGDEAAA